MDSKEESKKALKSTGIVGGGQILNILISLIRTKIVAVILGPSGIGIVGLFTTVSDMVRNITSLGLPFSGVRDISLAAAGKNENELSTTISIFLKWMLLVSILGAVAMTVFCVPLSKWMFGNTDYYIEIALLSVAVFFSSLSYAYNSVLQGNRAIGMMVKSGLYSSIISSVIGVVIYWYLKKDGIVIVMILTAIISFVFSLIYVNKLQIKKVISLSLLKSWPKAKTMVKIGFFTIIVSVFDQIMSLGLRSFISEKSGVEGVGLFTAATSIATTYLGIVLSSLGSDYYPKLAAINNDNKALQQSINLQLKIVLLLATPLIVGMICFSEIAIKLLYTNEFLKANDILQWHILGDFLKIIAWPCGYIFLAKGLGKLYIGFSLSYTIIYVGIVYFGWEYFGFFGIGVAFFIAQLLGMIFTYVYSFIKFNIAITQENQRIVLFSALILTCGYLSNLFLKGSLKLGASILSCLIIISYSIKILSGMIDIKLIVNNFISKFRK